MRTLCRRYRLHYCDLLGHPIDAVARVSGQPATMTPGGQPVLDSSYFKRIEAIEFAVRFDDGVGPGGLKDADIVLVGVSRSSKTPPPSTSAIWGTRPRTVRSSPESNHRASSRRFDRAPSSA
jgi:regulator of PEP synthase PpsR (kinase-PPPase family)